MANADEPDAGDDDADEAEQRASPGGHIVYEAIRREGDEELARPSSALAWSGLAAGLSMGFSLAAEAALRSHLPDQPWRPLVAKLGYCVGFLLVILGRQQLFTENTLTPVLPLLQSPSARALLNVLRLWSVVLAANLVGATLIALALTHTHALSPEARAAIVEIGREVTDHPFGTVFVKSICAGWLIAMIVWLMPFAESARVFVIVAITYVVGVAGFSHVVVGTVEATALAWAGAATWPAMLGGFVVPALLGNVVGGVTFVAALGHAQVQPDKDRRRAKNDDA